MQSKITINVESKDLIPIELTSDKEFLSQLRYIVKEYIGTAYRYQVEISHELKVEDAE